MHLYMHITSDKFFSKTCLSSPLFIFSHNLLRIVKATRRFYVLNSVTLYLTWRLHWSSSWRHPFPAPPISIQWTLRHAGEYRSSVHLTRLAIGTLKPRSQASSTSFSASMVKKLLARNTSSGITRIFFSLLQAADRAYAQVKHSLSRIRFLR